MGPLSRDATEAAADNNVAC